MTSHTKLSFPNLKGRVAIITGGSRGIGRECALALARAGCNVVIAAKSTESSESLPGSIHSVAEEAKKLGVDALACKVDLRDAESIEQCVQATVEKFKRIDILINNASALWWQDIVDTPMKKYDLINQINSRGTFAMTKACLPHMSANKYGRVIVMSPPIKFGGYAGNTAYRISKFGMTMVALGVAEEYKGKGITANSLWPATVVESQASINFKLGDRTLWRKATILSDATMAILNEPDTFTGNMLIDDDYLRSKGLTDEDFVVYRYDPEVEPPRILSDDSGFHSERGSVKRGDVRQVKKDIVRSSL